MSPTPKKVPFVQITTKVCTREGCVWEGPHVDLPTSFPVSEPYEKDGVLVVDVMVPKAITNETGRIDEAKLRKHYRKQPKWDRPGVANGVQA